MGAKQIIHREDMFEIEQTPLREERWAGTVDCVGGSTLLYILSTLQVNGFVDTSGFTGGMNVTTTMHPLFLEV
ncbi:hypothetical protein LJR153_006309 [Paenibacillus sp. LjRoot153]|uniref:hypothetical protein n=1 Tax=Paenibacillus sp. LjRoot153 TaxID=3342270 RepID=UPI003ED0E90A